MDHGYRVKLVNTAAVRVYEGMKYTGDEHDARYLAHLLRLGILPTGYIYPKEERGVRDLLRKRSQLVRARTAQILGLQNLISRQRGKGMSADHMDRLEESDVQELAQGDPHVRLAIQSHLEVIRCLNEQVALLEGTVHAQAKEKPGYRELLSVPGIGRVLGLTILYEAGEMGRFGKVGQFASYARCVSSRHMSNGVKKGEGNRKNGNKYLGWAFVEAAYYAVRWNERIRRYFDRKKAKKNRMVAAKAVAHKLARACYHVLKDRVPFDLDRAFA